MEENTLQSKIIVEGEASESDEEDIETQNTASFDQVYSADASTLPVNVQSTGPVAQRGGSTALSGVVVSGEASESDEEFEIITNEGPIPPLNVDQSEKGDTSAGIQSPTQPQPTREIKPKYNTLFHRKLRERNIALRRHIVDTIHQSYSLAAKDVHSLTLQLQKSHLAIQDVSRHMRTTTNDLFQLEDKVDIVRCCNILPDINISLS